MKKKVAYALLAALLLLWAQPLIAAEQGKININTASREQLMSLSGIGASYADRIIAHRDKNGPFQKPEDLMKVKGIGTKTYHSIKDRVVISNK